MNILDAIIILFIAFGGYIGFRRGVISSIVSAVGLILVFILAFILKNPISVLMYENLPFFKFGILKGIPILNILIYEALAFLTVLSILLALLKIVLFASRIFDRIIKMTIVLTIPSKILGGIVGIIEYIILAFIGLYILSLPLFNIDIINKSILKNKILNNTPIISGTFKNNLKMLDEFASLKEKYNNETTEEFNLESLDLLLKHKIVTVKSIDKLIAKDKIDIKNIDIVLDKYR